LELVYLWVEDYKNIHKQGFNFSPKFQCYFDDISNKLTINKKNNHIPNFFGKKINVTAVVGKNGSGKSNLLELVAYGKPTSYIPKTPDNFKELFEYYDLVIFYDEATRRFNLYGMEDHDGNSEIQHLDDSNFPQSIRLQYCSIDFDISTIYYSSSQDSIRGNNLPSHKKDISESFLFEKISSEIKKNNHVAVPFFTLWFINDSNNVQKSVELLKRKDILPQDFIRPDKLKIYINQNYVRTLFYKNLKDYFKIDETGNEIPEDHILYQLYILIRASTDTVSGFEYSLKFTLILIFIITELDNNRDNLLSFLDNLDITSTARYNLDTEANNDITEALDVVMKHYSNNHIIKAASNLLGSFNQLNNSYDNSDRCYKLSIEDDYEKIIKLIEVYRELIKVSASFLEFHFNPRLSSGGKELLFFFSKLSDELRMFPADSSINLILDEPNVFSHPNWQRKFLNMLLEFLNKNYSTFKFNIVIATHSPFLLSDIPQTNTIFLNTDESGFCTVVKGLKNDNQTFGANIHTLLRDGFFMGEGLMGEFAKGKIEKVINFLRSKNNNLTLEEAEKIIQIVGEPILKARLERMLLEYKDEKGITSKSDLKQEIAKLQDRLDNFGQNQINEND